jgi:hypothetical protein
MACHEGLRPVYGTGQIITVGHDRIRQVLDRLVPDEWALSRSKSAIPCWMVRAAWSMASQKPARHGNRWRETSFDTTLMCGPFVLLFAGKFSMARCPTISQPLRQG